MGLPLASTEPLVDQGLPTALSALRQHTVAAVVVAHGTQPGALLVLAGVALVVVPLWAHPEPQTLVAVAVEELLAVPRVVQVVRVLQSFVTPTFRPLLLNQQP